MVLRLYVHRLSQPARSLLLFCKANSIPHVEIAVDLISGEHKTQNYKETVHPFGKVPAIDHDGFHLIESEAILRYLAKAFPEIPDHWYPSDIQAQAQVDAYMSWQHLNLRTAGSMFFQHSFMIPKFTGRAPNEASIARFRKALDGHLQELATVWLKDRPFVAGQQISVADLLAVTELEQPGIVGYDTRNYSPVIKDYMERVRDFLQPHYEDVHNACRELKQQASQLA